MIKNLTIRSILHNRREQPVTTTPGGIFREPLNIQRAEDGEKIFRQTQQNSARVVDPTRRDFVKYDGKDSADTSCDEFLEVPLWDLYALSVVLRILQRVVIAGAEEEGDAPDTGQSDHGIDDARRHGGGSAADPGDQIELEQTDATPVQRADDGNNERDAIQNHHKRTYPFRGRRRARRLRLCTSGRRPIRGGNGRRRRGFGRLIGVFVHP